MTTNCVAVSCSLYLHVIKMQKKKKQIKVKNGINDSVQTDIILLWLHLFAQYAGSPLGFIKNGSIARACVCVRVCVGMRIHL